MRSTGDLSATPFDDSTARHAQTAERRASRLDRGLLSLDFRWPPAALVTAYRTACQQLCAQLAADPARSWTNVLHGFFGERVRERLQATGSQDLPALQRALREMSALGAMLMHLTVTRGTKRVRVHNERRKRTAYGTYPTSPRIASAMAHYLLRHLSHAGHGKREIRIVDPTMEGGPTLLELAFQLQPSPPGPRSLSRAQIVLVGVDQNPSAAPLVSTLLNTWADAAESASPQFDLRTADAFETLLEREPIFAITNNPPWGGSTDGATADRIDPFGPYVGYRDPYIALVSTGLKRLPGGGPFAFVLPFQVLTAPSAAGLRQELLANCVLDHVVLLPRSAFPRATIKSVMLLGRRHQAGLRRRAFEVVSYPITRKLSDPSQPSVMAASQRALHTATTGPWLAIVRSEPPVTARVRTAPLGSVASVAIGIRPYQVGSGNPKQTPQTFRERPFTFSVPTRGASPVARSGNIGRFRLNAVDEYTRIGAWLASVGRHMELVQVDRVFVREICGRDGSLVAAIAARGVVARYGLFTVTPHSLSAEALCALLNSSWVAGYVRSSCAGFHKESFGRVTASDLRNLPVPRAMLETTDTPESRRLRHRIRQLVQRLMSEAAPTPASSSFQELDALLTACLGGKATRRVNGGARARRFATPGS